MTRTLTGSHPSKALAATLAAALAFTPMTVAPARADNNGDAIAAAAFFGLVAAAIIASSRDSAAQPPHRPDTRPRIQLPAECRFVIRHGEDRGTWYGQRCLARNDAAWWKLPDRCAEWVELPRRHRDVVAYDAQCLARFTSRPAVVGHEDKGYDDRTHGDRSRRDR